MGSDEGKQEEKSRTSVLAVDPGRDKCGLALLLEDETVLWKRVIPREKLLDELARINQEESPERVVIGGGTSAREVLEHLVDTFGSERVTTVDETGSTMEARSLYFEEHPRRGLWRLVPLGLQLPPRPVDDYAAVVLGRRFLEGSKNP